MIIKSDLQFIGGSFQFLVSFTNVLVLKILSLEQWFMIVVKQSKMVLLVE